MKTRFLTSARCLAAAILLISVSAALEADEVRLKNGRVLRDVIAIPQKKGMVLVFSSGRTRYFPTREIALSVSRNVRWPRPVSRRRLKRLIEKRARERIRKLAIGDETAGLWTDNIALQDAEPLENGRRPFLWRSAILPGWGQWAEERKGAAAGFFLGSVGLGIAYLDNRRRVLEARNRFDESVLLGVGALADPFTAVSGALTARLLGNAAAGDEARFKARANLVLLLLAGLHGWNILDAYRGDAAPRLSARKPRRAGFSVHVRHGNRDTLGIAFAIHF